jgi:IS1 family transposase
MNRLGLKRRTQLVAALCDGNSIRATARMIGAAKNTVTKLLLDLGAACERYQDETLRGLPCKRIQCDEIWAFVEGKGQNLPGQHKAEVRCGDVWTWTALDTESKLVPSWAVGRRDGFTASTFIRDLAARLANCAQLTANDHRVCLEAVEGAFGAAIDYAFLVKMYEGDSSKGVERHNLRMRTLTRTTDAFARKLDNLKAAIALYFMHYNFARIHQSLRVTPAMEAAVSDHVWSIDELVGLLDWAGPTTPSTLS